MKRTLIVFSVLLIGTQLHAQNLSFGITGGLGHSWTNVDAGSLDKRFHTAYNLGGKMVYSFVTNWGISGDLKFSSEGQTIGNDKDNKSVVRANYIRIPIQGIYFFGKYGDRVRPKISIGPSFGILVGGKSRLISNGNELFERKSSEDLKTVDFGFTVAGGGNVRIAPATWLNLDLSYYHGLADIAESTDNIKNRNLGINIGVTFPLATLNPDKLKR